MARKPNLGNRSTEMPNVEMILCHFTKGELEGLDNLQGGPSIDPNTGLREYSKLSSIIEMPEIKKVFKLVNDDIEDDGKISPDLHKIYETAKQGSLSFEKAPQDNKEPTKHIEKKGRDGDTLLALIPLNVALFLIELRGHYSTNPKTGLLEFGFLKNVVNMVKRVVSNPIKAIGHGVKKAFGPEGLRVAGTIGGAMLGGPMGMGIGAGLSNAATGADFGKSMQRGLGMYGLGTGVQAAGQMMGLGAATPYSAGFFGGSNPITGLFGMGNAASNPSGWHQVMATPNSLASQASAAAAANGTTIAPVAQSSGFLGNLGSTLMSPAGLMLAATGASMLGDRQHYKQENERAKAHNREVDKMKEDMGYNLKWDDKPRRSRWVKNPKHTVGGRENYFLDEPEYYKKGGLVGGPTLKRPQLRSFDESTGIYGPGNGQDDKIKTSIPAGSYIIDASSTADLGDGSSSSGIKALEETAEQIRRKYPKKVVTKLEKYFQKRGEQTPVYLANEEFKFDPVTVALVGHGDMKKGADVFRNMVKNIRRHKNSNGLGLPPKAKHPMEYIKQSYK